jgi:hypothetical protein
MRVSPLRLIKGSVEFIHKDAVNELPRGLRGIYVLYRQVSGGVHPKYVLLYVGMAAAGRGRGLRGRLASHAKSKRKGKLWTHFSAFEVWGNIRNEEVAELEGLIRHIYRRDPAANRLNIQRGFKKARKLEKIVMLGRKN